MSPGLAAYRRLLLTTTSHRALMLAHSWHLELEQRAARLLAERPAPVVGLRAK